MLVTYRPLPVSLVSFTGQGTQNTATLSWETISETQNRGFAVERSIDGQEFTEIGFVNGAGNSQELNHYGYEDNNFTGRAWYRLKQIDFDGGSQLSDIVELKVVSPGQALPMGLFPNPYKDILFMQCDLCGIFDEQQVKIKVINAQGQLIMEDTGEFSQVSQNFSAKSLTIPRGIYWVEILANEHANYLKFIRE
jgi:hypothetical protein